MKEGWTYKKFADCIDKVPKQKQVKSKDYQPFGKYPIVSQEKELISGYWDDERYLYRHKKPVVVFGDHTKEIKYIDFDFIVGADGTQILSPKDGIDAKFFYYALLATPIRTLGYARHFKLLKEKSFIIPPLFDQLSIVSRLDAAFANIDALKTNVERQLAEARKLFQAELAECMRPKEGWEEKMLGEVCDIFGRIGFRGYTTKDLVASPQDGAISLSPTNIQNGAMDYSKLTYISWFKYEESPEIKIYNGDILLVKTGSSYGKSALVENLPHEATINPQSVVLKNFKIDNRFFAYQLRTNVIKEEFDKFVSGTAIPTFSQAKLSSVPIYYPSEKIQHQIVARLDALSAHIRQLEEVQRKTLAECDALKQAMLGEVFE